MASKHCQWSTKRGPNSCSASKDDNTMYLHHRRLHLRRVSLDVEYTERCRSSGIDYLEIWPLLSQRGHGHKAQFFAKSNRNLLVLNLARVLHVSNFSRRIVSSGARWIRLALYLGEHGGALETASSQGRHAGGERHILPAHCSLLYRRTA